MRRMILPLMLVAVACQPTTMELTEERRAAVVEELTQVFSDYAEVVRQLDQDALMGFFHQSDDIAWAVNGTITRSWTEISEAARRNWSAFANTESFAWGELHVQVLASNIAVVTTTFDFAATGTTGDPIAATGTFSTVWLHTDGGWKIVNSAETYPPGDAGPYGG